MSTITKEYVISGLNEEVDSSSTSEAGGFVNLEHNVPLACFILLLWPSYQVGITHLSPHNELVHLPYIAVATNTRADEKVKSSFLSE